MSKHSDEIQVLQNICNGLLAGNFKFLLQSQESHLEAWEAEPNRRRLLYSVESGNDLMTFDKFAEIVLRLIDQNECEGQKKK
jgi:hypothetical protein